MLPTAFKRRLFLIVISMVLMLLTLSFTVPKRIVLAQPRIPTANTYNVVVNANQAPPGVDTGVNVTNGTTLTIKASGTAEFGTESTDSCTTTVTDPDGQRITSDGTLCPPTMDPNAVLPSAPVGALIGRIGSSGWFAVGSSFSAMMHTNGEFFLLYNDVVYSDGSNAYGNNSGSYTVSVTQARCQPVPGEGSGVTFYAGANYQGQKVTYSAKLGEVDTIHNLPAGIAGHLGSFKDPKQAWHVVLYQGPNGTGNLGHYDANQPNVDAYWQNTQSVKVYHNLLC